MKISSRLACLLLLAIPFPGWSYGNDRYPLRQIDRPLILPKGMWQENLVWHQPVPMLYPGYGYGIVPEIQGFFPQLPSWSITDNLSWAAVPLPLFQYLLTHNNIQSGTSPVVEDFSLTLQGGLSDLFYVDEEITTYSGAGVSFKQPWSSRLWNEGYLSLSFRDWDPYYLGGSVGLGFQVTNRIHTVSNFHAGGVLQGGGSYLAMSLNQKCGINFHSGLSLDVGFEALEIFDMVFFNLNSKLSFQW